MSIPKTLITKKMEKLEFKVNINAPKEKVWETLWKDPTYKKWASVFSPDSKAITDWKEGSKVSFVSGKGDGMYGTIAKTVPNKLMSFKHLGVIKGGKEQPIDAATKKWSGITENYTLEESGGVTSLKVNMEAVEEHTDFYRDKFPKALESVKMLAENKRSENNLTDNKRTDNMKSDNMKPDSTKSDKMKTDNMKTDNMKSDKMKSDNMKSDNMKSDNTRSNTTKSDTSKSNTTRSDNTRNKNDDKDDRLKKNNPQ